ncbi:MAG: hypothetical protein ABI978_05410, partial [Chloroflexota bacterium]
LRVVASPDVLDAIDWPDAIAPLRLAPDDLFAVGATVAEVADEHAVVADEPGLVGWWLSDDELAELVLEHVDWPLPIARPALAQGLVAGVPAKLWLTNDRALLLCAAAYAHELIERLP